MPAQRFRLVTHLWMLFTAVTIVVSISLWPPVSVCVLGLMASFIAAALIGALLDARDGRLERELTDLRHRAMFSPGAFGKPEAERLAHLLTGRRCVVEHGFIRVAGDLSHRDARNVRDALAVVFPDPNKEPAA